MKKHVLTIITLLIFSNLLAEGLPQIGIYEKLDDYIPENLEFINDKGETQNLSEIIDKPTVITMVYFNCPGICSPLLDGVATVIDRNDMILGSDYQVLTISFNWDETWQLGKNKKDNYLKQITKDIDTDGWQFMAGDSANIMSLVNAIGFGFQKEGEDYIHAAAIVMLSPESKITRYLYGTTFLPFDLKMAAVEAAQGKSGPTINKVLEYCFSYDAEGKQYVFNITKVSATIILFFALTMFLWLVLTRKKRKKSHI
jgi:protein SCO1